MFVTSSLSSSSTFSIHYVHFIIIISIFFNSSFLLHHHHFHSIIIILIIFTSSSIHHHFQFSLHHLLCTVSNPFSLHHFQCIICSFSLHHFLARTSPEASVHHPLAGEDSGMNSSDMNNNDFDRVDMEVSASNSDAAAASAPSDSFFGAVNTDDADDEMGSSYASPLLRKLAATSGVHNKSAGPAGDISGIVFDKGGAATSFAASLSVVDETGDKSDPLRSISTSVVNSNPTFINGNSNTVAFFQVDLDEPNFATKSTATKTKSLAEAFALAGKASMIGEREAARINLWQQRQELTPSSGVVGLKTAGGQLTPGVGRRKQQQLPQPQQQPQQQPVVAKLGTTGRVRSTTHSPTPASSSSVTGEASTSSPSSPSAAFAVKSKQTSFISKADGKIDLCSLKASSLKPSSLNPHQTRGGISDAKRKEMEMKERTKRLVQRLEEVKKANMERQKKVCVQKGKFF